MGANIRTCQHTKVKKPSQNLATELKQFHDKQRLGRETTPAHITDPDISQHQHSIPSLEHLPELNYNLQNLTKTWYYKPHTPTVCSTHRLLTEKQREGERCKQLLH